MADSVDGRDPRTVTGFLAYSHKDEELLDRLLEHLAPLRRSETFSAWHDRKIEAGEEWGRAIDEKLKTSDIILLLVSSSFINSDYCYNIELKEAISRHESREARVIPIIMRPCVWQGTPLGRLQALPRDGKAITEWSNQDTALVKVVEGISRAVDSVLGADETSGLGLTEATRGSASSHFGTLSSDFDELLRRITVDWQTERRVSEYRTDDARELMADIASQLRGVRTSAFVDARPFLHSAIDRSIVDAVAIERDTSPKNEFQLRNFWQRGNEAIERLEASDRALRSIAQAGLDPIDGVAMDRLLQRKACIRLLSGESWSVDHGFRGNDWVLIEIPVRNEGRHRAYDVAMEVASELDDSKPHPEGTIEMLDSGELGTLYFSYRRNPPTEPPQAEDRLYRLRIRFRDDLGSDIVGYAVHLWGILGQNLWGKPFPERTISSLLCPGLIFQELDEMLSD